MKLIDITVRMAAFSMLAGEYPNALKEAREKLTAHFDAHPEYGQAHHAALNAASAESIKEAWKVYMNAFADEIIADTRTALEATH